MITDHMYDAGFPRDDSQGCIVLVHMATFGQEDEGGRIECGQPEDEHQDTEYSSPPGDMHEPKPYTGELDWLPIGNDSDNE